MWSMSLSGRIEKRQSWGGPWSPKWSRRLPDLIELPINGNTCVNGGLGGKKIGRPRKYDPRPWEIEGISRQMYYRRRQKSKGEV
jgi:hypothetical protein